jgi:hypothetical protein
MKGFPLFAPLFFAGNPVTIAVRSNPGENNWMKSKKKHRFKDTQPFILPVQSFLFFSID